MELTLHSGAREADIAIRARVAILSNVNIHLNGGNSYEDQNSQFSNVIAAHLGCRRLCN